MTVLDVFNYILEQNFILYFRPNIRSFELSIELYNLGEKIRFYTKKLYYICDQKLLH